MLHIYQEDISDTDMLKYSCVLLFSLFLKCGKRTLINSVFEMQVFYVMYDLFVILSVSLITINYYEVKNVNIVAKFKYAYILHSYF